ncbi:MAG: hypothetical protein AAGA50_15590 [Pseudomonadota bacterium]
MYSVRPAFPRSFYAFGAALTALLLVMSALQDGSAEMQVAETVILPPSPQVFALDLNQ